MLILVSCLLLPLIAASDDPDHTGSTAALNDSSLGTSETLQMLSMLMPEVVRRPCRQGRLACCYVKVSLHHCRESLLQQLSVG